MNAYQAPDEGSDSGAEQRLRKAADFREEIERRGQADLRRELGLPNIDQILKDLQKRYGVRISLSPNLIERLEQAKRRSADEVVVRSGCFTTDSCILCDHGDICSTCDTSDWCIWNDTHIV